MRFVYKTVLTLGVAALLASPLLAQPGRGGGFGRMNSVEALLKNDSVKKELKIDKDEGDKINDALKKVDDENKDDVAKLQDPNTSREDRADLSKKLNAAYEKAVADILTADQKKRFKQIRVQVQGVQAFSDTDVVKALALTDDQKSKIKDIGDDLAKGMQDLRGGGGGGGGNFQKMQELRKDALDKTIKLLTDDQKKTWKDLTGDPFQLQMGGGGGRGGGGANPPARAREA